MTGKLKTREVISLWLVGIILVCLVFALTGEAIDFVWLRQPIGNIAWNVADVFGWLFAIALVAEFIIVVSMQDRRPRPGQDRSGRNTRARPGTGASADID